MKVTYRRPLKNRFSILKVSYNVTVKRLTEMIDKGYKIEKVEK